MARIPFTLRIDAEERIALEHLSELEGRPINQLLNEAIKSYLSQQSPKEASLEASLSALQKYRKRDPGFKRAIAAFVDAEARHADPLEGKPVEGQFVGGQFQPVGPVQSKIRDLLRA
jgi:predicted transcriptional regulator